MISENESLFDCFALEPATYELNEPDSESSGLSSAINEFRSSSWLPDSAYRAIGSEPFFASWSTDGRIIW